MIDVSLISRFFDARNGGLGTYSEMVLKSLQNQKNIKLQLISQKKSILYRKNVSIDWAKHLDYLFYSLVEKPFIVKKSDIYHALSPIESLWLDSEKSVVTIHDLLLTKMPEMIHSGFMAKPFGIYYDKTMNKAIKAKEIIAISNETAQELIEYYNLDDDNIHVVRQAIKDYLKPNSNMNNENIFSVGTISHLNKRKRIEILIKSFLEASIANSELLIGGTGNQLQYLKKIANGDARVKFLGFVPDDELSDFYNSLDVFVFPSIMEGYGLPIVEAMACNKPVITLNDGEIPKDVKDKTFISSKENLAKDLKNKNFEINNKSNLKFVKEHSTEKCGEKLIEIYKKALE
jgi:glycosyltransferase involved in cell wall biosynthesis